VSVRFIVIPIKIGGNWHMRIKIILFTLIGFFVINTHLFAKELTEEEIRSINEIIEKIEDIKEILKANKPPPPVEKKLDCIEFNKEKYTSKNVPAELTNPENDSFEQMGEFVRYMLPLAIHFQEKYKIPAELILTTAIDMSSFGNASFVKEYNNLFAISCRFVDVGTRDKSKYCSKDHKFFKFDHAYEAADFHIKFLYFSDFFPTIKKQVATELEKNASNKDFIISIDSLIPTGRSNSNSLIVEDWNKLATYKYESVGDVYEEVGCGDGDSEYWYYGDTLRIYLKDLFPKIDFTKFKICK